MNILLVYAHPEPQSLNGSLKDFAVQYLKRAGHKVQVSDLYAMRWKSTVDALDNTAQPRDTRFNPTLASIQAFQRGTQSADIVAEQEKLLWADALILQFPLWWFSMPAILKGWVDRVYACGFAYGVGEHSASHWGDRYGEGTLAGKRAMLMVTTGSWESHFGPRGVNGPIDDLLFPIHHGILFYPGFDVLPPHVIYRSGKLDQAGFTQACETLARRLDDLFITKPIPFRKQNGGDYRIPELSLQDDLAPGKSGFSIHLAST